MPRSLAFLLVLGLLFAPLPGRAADEQESKPAPGTFDAVFAAAPNSHVRVSESSSMTFSMFMIPVTTKNHAEYAETTLAINWNQSTYAVERRYDMAEAGGSWALLNESIAADVGDKPLRIDSREGIRYVDAGTHDKEQRDFVKTLKPLDFDWFLLRAIVPHGRRGRDDTWELPEAAAARLLATVLQEAKGDARLPWVENPDLAFPERGTEPEAAGAATGRFKKLNDDIAVLVIDFTGSAKLDTRTRARDVRGTVTLHVDLRENRFTRLDAKAAFDYDEDSGESFRFKVGLEKTWEPAGALCAPEQESR